MDRRHWHAQVESLREAKEAEKAEKPFKGLKAEKPFGTMEAGSPQELEGLVDSREPVLGWLGEAQRVDDECLEHRIQSEMADIRHMMAGGHKHCQMVAIENWRAEYAVTGIVALAR